MAHDPLRNRSCFRKKGLIVPRMGPFNTLKRRLSNNSRKSDDKIPQLAQDFGEFQKVVDNINAREGTVERLTDDQLIKEFEQARAIASRPALSGTPSEIKLGVLKRARRRWRIRRTVVNKSVRRFRW